MCQRRHPEDQRPSQVIPAPAVVFRPDRDLFQASAPKGGGVALGSTPTYITRRSEPTRSASSPAASSRSATRTASSADAERHRGPELVGQVIRVQRCPMSAARLLAFAATWRTACARIDRKSTRLNSSHANISYAVFCLKKKS